MKIDEFDDFCVRHSPGRILSELKRIVEEADNTDCQNLEFFQSTRRHFDAQDQCKGTIYEKRLRRLSQRWLAGEV